MEASTGSDKVDYTKAVLTTTKAISYSRAVHFSPIQFDSIPLPYRKLRRLRPCGKHGSHNWEIKPCKEEHASHAQG